MLYVELGILNMNQQIHKTIYHYDNVDKQNINFNPIAKDRMRKVMTLNFRLHSLIK